MKRTIAVREIAYFLYSSGDLSADFFSNASSNDGKKAHQYLQRKYKSEDMKEYYIKHNLEYRGDEICIHGYIDGVLNIEGKIVLEEIKSTKRNLYDIDIDYHKEHLAQLMIYGYMYGDLFGLDKVDMQLTYIKVGDYKTKIIPLSYTINELKSFFYDSIDKYLDWLSIIEEKNSYKLDSIKNIKFPFENMRKGQLDFMKASYYTLSHKEILYTIAPTGIGKTMAALFSGLKALENNTDKLFYLTSKNMQKNICVDSIKLLNSKGLKIKSLVLTSKAKSCLNSSKVCDPDKCIYAKGFFNRLRDAFMDIYENYDLYTYDIILAVSKEHTICPFEFALYLSYFCDLVICDYNYVFDPRAHLIRYFEDNTYSPKLLIDEAHNLVSRGNDMYSSSLLFSDMDRMVNILSSYDKYLLNLVEDLFDEFNRLDPYFIEEEVYYSNIIPESFLVPIYKLKAKVEEIFSDEENIENKDEALLLYFNLKDFADTLEFYGESHVFIVNKLNNNYKVEIMCLDAAEFIYKTINLKCHGAVLFSATLYPIKYYMDLLTMGNGRFMTLESPFDRNKLNLIINTKISTKYKDRENTIGDIIEIVDTLVNSKKGNHIVFFPSYKYMELFLNNIDISKYNLIIQTSDMNEIERINMFEMFKDTSQSHLGLFVLGGSFSEGIDFKDDLLSGVVVVGVGIPQVNLVNNLAKEYFDELYESGYDYAYTYPGLNKVIQAAGRVIRNETDRGSVILIDERYKYAMYQSLFPHHWSHRRIINNIDMLKNCLNDFYKENNDE